MAKCYAMLGVLTCDLEEGHQGAHFDAWILDGQGHTFSVPTDKATH